MANRLICPNCGHEQVVSPNINIIKCSVCNKHKNKDLWKNSDSKEIPNIMKKQIVKLLQEVGRIKNKEKSMDMVIEYLRGVFDENV